ncbi:hypothetical protein J6590_093803 [Homalodisca vitripennis]|nr:hypothetical protein J6590_093803 [Homalodisca vitripennis]
MVGVRLGFAYWDAPILAIGQSLSLHALSTRRSVHDVLFLFKLLNNLVDAPELLALISFRCPTAQTRSRELFVRKHVDTNYRANFFSNRVHHLERNNVSGTKSALTMCTVPTQQKLGYFNTCNGVHSHNAVTISAKQHSCTPMCWLLHIADPALSSVHLCSRVDWQEQVRPPPRRGAYCRTWREGNAATASRRQLTEARASPTHPPPHPLTTITSTPTAVPSIRRDTIIDSIDVYRLEYPCNPKHGYKHNGQSPLLLIRAVNKHQTMGLLFRFVQFTQLC